jgi:hypothetical protein
MALPWNHLVIFTSSRNKASRMQFAQSGSRSLQFGFRWVLILRPIFYYFSIFRNYAQYPEKPTGYKL